MMKIKHVRYLLLNFELITSHSKVLKISAKCVFYQLQSKMFFKNAAIEEFHYLFMYLISYKRVFPLFICFYFQKVKTN